MKELPLDLYHQCQTVLQECDEFQSNKTLEAVFGTSQLRDYSHKIPEADSRDLRVTYCLNFLRNRHFKGEPALALFLEILSSRYPIGDDIAIALGQLAQQVRMALSETLTPQISSASTLPVSFSETNTQQRIPSSAAPTATDVGIIFALKEEFAELFREFEDKYTPTYDEETDNYYYQFQRTSIATTSPYQCVTTFAGGMGAVKASLLTEKLFSKWKPRLLVIVGIAAALDDDVQLGDVVVAEQVNLYLDNSKAVPATGGTEFTFQLSPESYRGSHDVLNLVQHFDFTQRAIFLDWQKHGTAELQQLSTQEKIAKMVSSGSLRKQPLTHVGHVASGPTVGAAIAFKTWLRKHDRKYLALEMETGGFMEAVQQHTNPIHQQLIPGTLILRAISDYGDERKKRLDGTSKGALRRYALHNAIRFLWSILDTGFLLNSY